MSSIAGAIADELSAVWPKSDEVPMVYQSFFIGCAAVDLAQIVRSAIDCMSAGSLNCIPLRAVVTIPLVTTAAIVLFKRTYGSV